VTLLDRYDKLDKLLVLHGFPPTSPWWRRELERFVKSGRRRWVLRVGRRGGKSSTLCRLAVVVALWGEWSVPPGDTAVIPIVSVKREEASDRLTTVRAILNAIGVAHSIRGSDIDIPERRACISVTTCSLAGTIGFTSVMVFADEMATWRNTETGANPAEEVMASLRPTMATQPTAFEVCSSAPWGLDDLHAELFAAGEDNQAFDEGRAKLKGYGQIVSFAPTWEANPTITEEETHELEPDPRIWSRAYAAIPSESVTGDWFGIALDVAIGSERCAEQVLPWVRYLVAIDPAFQRDHFGYAVLSCRSLPADPRYPSRDRRIIRVHECGAWKPEGGERSPTQMAFRVRDELCSKYHVGSVKEQDGTAWVITDQFEGQSFADLARQAGIVLQVVPWTAGQSETSQIARYRSVRLAMMEGTFQLPAGQMGETLERDLRMVGSRLLAGGNESILLPRNGKSGHMDTVSAVMLGASELLLRSPQPEWKPEPIKTDVEQHREEMRMAIIRKRRTELERDPWRGVRAAIRR
jgi:hypothetical protein